MPDRRFLARLAVCAAFGLFGMALAPPEPAQEKQEQPAQEKTEAPKAAPAEGQKAAPPKSNAALRDQAWGMLRDGAGSENARTRSDTISALAGLSESHEAISLVQQGLKDKETKLRLLAATSLGGMKARSAIPQLRESLNDPSGEVSFAAAQSLWKMDDRSGRDLLYEVISGERKVKPGVIRSKMNKAGEIVHDPKAMLLIGINEASGALLGPFSLGVSFAEEYAKNNSAPVQALCAQMLARDDRPNTISVLSDALHDKNWSVRAAAMRSLAELHRSEFIPQFADTMENDKNGALRFVAAATIVRLTEPKRKLPGSGSATAQQTSGNAPR
jgi:HEAT repeat protein